MMRGFMGAYAHSLFTSMTAIGLILSRKFGKISIIIGFLIAVVIHTVWNGSLLLGTSGYYLMWAVVYVPCVLFIYKFLQREKK